MCRYMDILRGWATEAAGELKTSLKAGQPKTNELNKRTKFRSMDIFAFEGLGKRK